LRGTAISANEVKLTWTDNANNEDGFKIEESDGGDFSEIASLTLNTGTYTRSGLLPGKTYAYRVRAYNSNGASDYATIVVAPGGLGTGLKGEYFDNADLTAWRLTRTDPTVKFNWDNQSPDPSMDPDYFSVRWTELVQCQST